MYKSLWDRCFWEVFGIMKKRGATEIKFTDVDALVLQKSTMDIKDLIEYLGASKEDLIVLINSL